MTHILKLTRDDPVIHLKAYGGVQITGVDQAEVQCEIDAPQLATLLEKEGHVYITVNSSCTLTVPVASSLEIERGMGSVKISNVKNQINIEKALGNLVLLDVGSAAIEKVGGNFSVRQAAGDIRVEKVGGKLVVDQTGSFACEKVGGNCYARNVAGDFSLSKAGGKFVGEGISGSTIVSKIGGSFKGRGVNLEEDLNVGGNISLMDFGLAGELKIRAGGNIDLALNDRVQDVMMAIRSGGQRIKIKTQSDDLDISDYTYEYQLGEGNTEFEVAAGGKVSITDQAETDQDLMGDLSEHFDFEESAFSEFIQDRIDAATRLADAKIRTAEIRLEQMRERVEKHRGFNIDVDLDDVLGQARPKPQRPPVPPVTRPAGKKGATDEERLMILQMLQDNKISVDDAETLFNALED